MFCQPVSDGKRISILCHIKKHVSGKKNITAVNSISSKSVEYKHTESHVLANMVHYK